MILLGIDPGLKGAMSFIDMNNNSIRIFDMPVKISGNKSVVDGKSVFDLISKYTPDFAYVESVHTSPQMGVVSAGNFMYGKSSVITALEISGTKIIQVPPAKWKRAMRVPSDKREAVRRIKQLLPSTSSFFYGPRDGLLDGRAEACCIALYGALEQGVTIPTRFEVFVNE